MNTVPDNGKQMPLFDGRSLNVTAQVKEAMRRALSEGTLSREQVVDRMNALCQAHGIQPNGRAKAISLDMLEKWLSAGADHVLPLKHLAVFCEAAGSDLPVRALAAPLRLTVADEEDARLLEWARMERQRRKLLREQKKLEGDLI